MAHARGEVLFIAGSGVSRGAGLPDFRELVVEVYKYKALDLAVHSVISKISSSNDNQEDLDLSDLEDNQKAEVERFRKGEYDVVLGMLERRLEGETNKGSLVRQATGEIIGTKTTPAPIHRNLMRLADRGDTVTIITTNFDRSLDFLEGIDRLRALEQKLSAPRRGWDDDPAGQAWDWLREEGNSVLILEDIESRRSLAFSLVIEFLHTLREGQDPAVEQDRIQQMIRLLDDEVRTYCAEMTTDFVNELSKASDQEPNPPSPEHLFQVSAKPFLQQVWPQERSLTSPGISNRLSRLPAIARGEFA